MWIVLIDADVVPAVDAFGRLRRALASQPALLGGRAMVAGRLMFGAMFAPVRCGPHPFELAPVTGFKEERGLAELVRGPLDVPQRGLIVVNASFVRELPVGTELDPSSLHVDLAVAAHVCGGGVLCEPAMSFASDGESVALRRRMLGLQRYANRGNWNTNILHRQPPALRSRLVDRDTRVMGNFRGYAKRPLPPIETVTFRSRDASLVRAALARTGERYVLLAAADAQVAHATVEALIERIERSGRYALALEREEPPYGAVLVHSARLAAGGTLRGDTVSSVLADAIARLPEQRLYAVGPRGAVVPNELPALPRVRSLDVVYVAASQPVVTNQTLQALMQERASGITTAVFAAGAETTRRLFASYGEVRLVADTVDPILAVGLNRALAMCTADAIAIVRDDVQVTHGMLERLRAAFDRVARLGVAVPRVGGADRPEGLPDLSYGNIAELQAFADRRAAAFAREAMLVEAGTTPVLVVARAVLDIVGGFDEAFGFSRFGIEDFTRRVRSANFHVARCDDAYAHMFPADQVGSLLSPLDGSASHLARYQERWLKPRGFDPARDLVPLRVREAPRHAASSGRVRVLIPIADATEWASLEPALLSLARTFRASDPIDVAIGLDGTFALGDAVAALREMFVGIDVPMDETLNVMVESVRDIAKWRDAREGNVRLAASERDALAAVEAVDDASALHACFREYETV